MPCPAKIAAAHRARLAAPLRAAFAAQLGTMQVNEEIDAFKTLGISPVDFLVLPRILALMLMVPLLTLYSGFVGMFAGLVVSVTIFDISLFEYYNETLRALELKHFWVGLSKAPLFAMVIALIGCLEGFKVTGSAQSVGERTTSSVVQSIFVVIVLDALAALFLMEMGW